MRYLVVRCVASFLSRVPSLPFAGHGPDKERARELNLANSISQVIWITAAFIYGASLQQFTMFYSCPPCSTYSLVFDLFVKPDFLDVCDFSRLLPILRYRNSQLI